MLLAALVAVSLSAPPAAAKAPPRPFTQVSSLEGMTEYALPNGLKVLFVPDPSKPSVTVNLTVFVGSRHENYGEKGMAHLFEHMLFKRTKKFASIKDELTKLGGWANGTTWYDRTNYFESFPADDAKVQRAIELEAERLRNAIVSRDELATEMTVVRNELEAGENQPVRVLEQRLVSAAFEWHNYGDDTIGPRSDIENVPNEKLLAWYETYYQPDNAMLIVAGRFDEAKTFKAIADTFGKLQKPKRVLPKTYTVEPTQDGEKSVVVRRVGGAPVLMVGYHVPAGTDPDFASIDILDRALGASPSGRLYKALVETKKAAKVRCQNFQVKEPGYLICIAELGPKDPVGPARDALVATMEGLARQPLTKEEVERAKVALAKDIETVLSTSDRVGIMLSEFAAMGDWRMLFLHRDRIAEATVEDVMRVYGKYFKPSNRTLAEYVPTEKPDRAEIPALVDLGPVLKDYKGKAAMAEGEAFEASPKNIDARTTRTALSNGMKLALLPKKTRGETVNVAIDLNWGDEKSLANLRAPGEFAARMLLRGTKKKSRQEVKDTLDKLKAQVNVRPGPQSVTVGIEVHRPELAATLELIAECLKEPAFDATEFENLRREVLADAEKKKDDPMAIGQLGLQRMMSPFQKGHPLYVPSWPEIIADAQAVKPEQAKDYHARFYGAQAGYAAVVGDFDDKAVTAQLEKLFGGWKAPTAYTYISAPYSPVEPKVSSIETPDKAMAFFGAGVVFQMKDDHPDYPAMVMADYLLGGGFLAGRVPQRLREKEGLSYGAGTFMRVSGRDDRAALMGYAIYAPQNVEKVEKGFFEEVDKAVTSGFTEKELALAREGLLKEREQSRSEDGMLAMDLIDQLDLGRTMAFEGQVDEKLKALKVTDVGATLKKYVDAKKLAALKVGDFKKVAAPK
ncbi:MAG: pitrilysin family protein [Myxococcota bacterium]